MLSDIYGMADVSVLALCSSVPCKLVTIFVFARHLWHDQGCESVKGLISNRSDRLCASFSFTAI